MSCGGAIGGGRIPTIASSMAAGCRPPAHCLNEKMPLQPPSNMNPQHRGDDGSSGYGSPDSETFETPQAQ